MKITIVYDNESNQDDLTGDWGFACVVEAYGRTILFDTGAKGDILLDNLHVLKIEPTSIDEIFLSHDHFDHNGGIDAILKRNNCPVYVPLSFRASQPISEIVEVGESVELHKNIFSTGEILNIEQSLVINTIKGLVIIVGCAHSKVENILKAASAFGKPWALIGGLHDFTELDLLSDLELICATHCTEQKEPIKDRFPKKFFDGGVGKVLIFE